MINASLSTTLRCGHANGIFNLHHLLCSLIRLTPLAAIHSAQFFLSAKRSGLLISRMKNLQQSPHRIQSSDFVAMVLCLHPLSEFVGLRAGGKVTFHPQDNPPGLRDDLDRLAVARMKTLRAIFPGVRYKNYVGSTGSAFRLTRFPCTLSFSLFLFHLSSLSSGLNSSSILLSLS